MSEDILPKFNKPPVIEMLIGIDFEALPNWGIPHFGLFWNRIRDRYKHFADKNPLPPHFETFGAQNRQQAKLDLILQDTPDARCWYIDEDQVWLLQVQRSRFIQNWRKTRASDAYPKYGTARDRFESELLNFLEFTASEKIGDLEVKQCEVSYINHIEFPSGHSDFSKLGEISPAWVGEYSREFLPTPEVVVLNSSYLIPENKGRLHISMQPAFRHTDAKDILQLTMTAKVIPDSSNISDVLMAMDIGHEWAVRGFVDFTSPKMHGLWERRQ